MTAPTVGRIVYFTPAASDTLIYRNGNQPLAAVVAYVHSDECVNLSVFDANGNQWPRTSVAFIQGDAEIPSGGYFCQWMPYQLAQAAKADAPVQANNEMESAVAALTSQVAAIESALAAFTAQVAALPTAPAVQVAAPAVTASAPAPAQPAVAANAEPIAQAAAPASALSDAPKGA